MMDYIEKLKLEDSNKAKEMFDFFWPVRPEACPECGSKNIIYTIQGDNTYNLEGGEYSVVYYDNDASDPELWLDCKDCGWDGVDCWE